MSALENNTMGGDMVTKATEALSNGEMVETSTDTLQNVGLYEEKVCKNGKVRKVKSKAVLKQKIIISFSRKMMEYQRYIRNRQIERAKNCSKILTLKHTKKDLMMLQDLSNVPHPQNPATR